MDQELDLPVTKQNAIRPQKTISEGRRRLGARRSSLVASRAISLFRRSTKSQRGDEVSIIRADEDMLVDRITNKERSKNGCVKHVSIAI